MRNNQRPRVVISCENNKLDAELKLNLWRPTEKI